jgi:Asp-tRNA(Asn)/Glu-tRNA(Gln) amidotransferase A subunit family amidase
LQFPENWEESGELTQTEIVALMSPAQQDSEAAIWQRSPNNPIHRGYLKGSKPNLAQYLQVLNKRDARRQSIGQFFVDFDAFVCPVSSRPAPPPGAVPNPLVIDGRSMESTMAVPAYPNPFSYLGLPVVTMPLRLSSEGLPIGAQLVGRAWGDLDLLSVASLLAAIVGPAPRPPGF